jgi:hypothetical protein
MTSSPGLMMARSEASTPSEAPTVMTSSCAGRTRRRIGPAGWRDELAQLEHAAVRGVVRLPRLEALDRGPDDGSGVVKSGSPMVRLMTSFISASMSKKRRMPDGGMARTRR